MSKSFVFILLLVAGLGGFGYWYANKDKNRLRLDNFTLRGKQSGVAGEGPVTFKPGEELALVYSMRGATANQAGNCRVEMTVKVSGPAPVEFMEPRRLDTGGYAMADLSRGGVEEYHKNTDITSLECNAKATPVKEGKYEMVVHVHDEVANKDLDKKVEFTVAP